VYLMMGIATDHFNRSRVVASLAGLLGGAVGCGEPEMGHVTPVLAGRLTNNGVPVAQAMVAVMLHGGAARPADDECSAPGGARPTSDSGNFSLRGTRRVQGREAAREERRGSVAREERFALCVRLPDAGTYRMIFEAPANRWDTLQVACDLVRPWLARDAEGREGQCVVAAAAVSHVGRLPAPPAGAASPDIVCNANTTVIERLRIGPVRVNGSIAELRRLCPSLRDTIVTGEGWLEPGEQRALVLTIRGTPVIIHPAAGVVAMISVRSSGLYSADSIGVGTPLARLRRLPDLRVVAGASDIQPFAVAWRGSECGLGYYLVQPGVRQQESAPSILSEARLRNWAGTLPVRRVVVGFCPTTRYPNLANR
jgi:hypothetical protein